MEDKDILLVVIFASMVITGAIFTFMEIRRQTMGCKKGTKKGGKGK